MSDRKTAEQAPALQIFILALACAIVVLQGLVFHWSITDDAYISFRYASNLADGNGLVFNPGEQVEGYTNFLWTMVIAACAKAGIEPTRAAPALGPLFACLALILTWLVSRRIACERGWPEFAACLPPLVLACYPGWSYWAFSGMEQPFLACLILLFIYCGTGGSFGAARFCLTAVFGLLAALTRWESVMLWPVIAAARLFDNSRRSGARWLTGAALLTVLILFFGSYFLWRFSYYGEIMPNTYYAKLGSSVFQRISWGLVYTGEMGVQWWLPLGIVLWLCGWRRPWSFVLLLTMLLYTLYVTWTGGDHFAWLRFYAPVLPVAAIMVTEIIDRICATPTLQARQRTGLLLVAAAVVIIMAGSAFRIDYRAAQRHHSYVRWWGEVGRWAKLTLPDNYTLAVIPAGIIPYVSRHPVLDLMGLTDYETAHFGDIDMTEAPGHQKSFIGSVLRRKPEIILGEALPFEHPPSPEDVLKKTNRHMLRTLYRLPEFQKLYEFRTVKINGRYTSLWAAKDL